MPQLLPLFVSVFVFFSVFVFVFVFEICICIWNLYLKFRPKLDSWHHGLSENIWFEGSLRSGDSVTAHLLTGRDGTLLNIYLQNAYYQTDNPDHPYHPNLEQQFAKDLSGSTIQTKPNWARKVHKLMNDMGLKKKRHLKLVFYIPEKISIKKRRIFF